MVDSHSIVTICASVLAGAIGMATATVSWRAPRNHQGLLALTLGLTSGMLICVVVGGNLRLGAVAVWTMAPVFALLCWRLERIGAEVLPIHGVWATASVFPGALLAVRALPSSGPATPSAWLLGTGPERAPILASLHLLFSALPSLALLYAAHTGSPTRRSRRRGLSAAAAIGGCGLASAGILMTSHPTLASTGAAAGAPAVALLLAWSVIGPSLWTTATETYVRAANAVSMSRIVSNTTARLGRELALAHAHARSLSGTPELRELTAVDDLLNTLERGQDLAGILSRSADGDAHQRSVIELPGLISRVVRYAGSGRKDVATVSTTAPNVRVWMNAATLERALLAVIRNALQAQQAAGSTASIEIRTRVSTNVHRANHVIAGTVDRDRYLVVEVVDRGDGLDPTTLARCLEPFFSTRDGQDGLGLFDVLALVRTEHAAFELSTNQRQTHGALWLPIHEQAVEESSHSWSWQQLGMVSDNRDVIVVDPNPRRLEKFGLLLAARGLSWGGVPDVPDLVAGTLGPRADGVIVLMDALSGREATLLTRWMAPRLAHTVARPAVVAGLIARGMSADETLAFQSERAHAVMSAVETVLRTDSSAVS